MTHEEFTGVTFNDLDPSRTRFQGHWSFPSSRDVPVFAIATATDVQQTFRCNWGFLPERDYVTFG